MNVEIYNPGRETGEALILKKISRLVWKHQAVGLSNLVFKTQPIFIRMDNTMFLATWDDTDNVGVLNLTKAEFKRVHNKHWQWTGYKKKKKGEHINSILKKHRGIVRAWDRQKSIKNYWWKRTPTYYSESIWDWGLTSEETVPQIELEDDDSIRHTTGVGATYSREIGALSDLW